MNIYINSVTTPSSLVSLTVLGLQIASISTNFWTTNAKLSFGPQTGSGNWGLWKMCSPSGCSNIMPTDPTNHIFPRASLYAVRILMILGTILVMLSVIPSIHSCVYLFLGSMFSLIATLIWYKQLLSITLTLPGATIKGSPGYSYFLNLAAGLVGLIAALVCFRKH